MPNQNTTDEIKWLKIFRETDEMTDWSPAALNPMILQVIIIH